MIKIWNRTTCGSARSKSALLVTAALAAGPALAQTGAAPNTVEEITVVSTRRGENLQKAPVAITAVTAETLDKSGINDLQGLSGLVPGLSVDKGFGFETVATIRGVGSETPQNVLSTTPGVAFFVDGVYISNSISPDMSMFDLDHLEVLRGPQGALYGQSATGGAITLVSKQPELGRFGGDLDFSAGDYNYFRERAVLNIPILDSLAIRVGGQRIDRDGYVTNTVDPSYTLDDTHNTTGKVSVLWKPIEKFSATLSAQWFREDDDGAALKNLHDPNPDPYTVSWDFNPRFNLDQQIYHGTLDYQAPWFEIRSISAYQELSHYQRDNATFSTVALYGGYNDVANWTTKMQSISEEFDLLSNPGSPLTWIAGVFLLKQRMQDSIAELTGTGNPVLNVPSNFLSNPPSNLSFGEYTNAVRRSYAPFLQLTYPVTDRLRVTAGARFNDEQFELANLEASAGSPHATPPTTNTTRVFTYRGQVEYDLTEDNLLYASVSRGYKPGGVNGNPTAVVVPLLFKTETNTGYEIGSKNTFFDRTLRANFAAFYDVYHNMQYIEADPFPFADSMANIPHVTTYGLEAETSYLAMDDKLRTNVNLTLENGQVQGTTLSLDSTVTAAVENTNPNCAYGGPYYNPKCWSAVLANYINLRGNSPPAMPTVVGSINVSYDFEVFKGDLTPRVEFLYRGDSWARIFNDPTLDKVKAYSLWNFNLTYAPTGSNLTFSFIVTNLFDRAAISDKYTNPYEENGSNYTHETGLIYVPPRMFSFDVAYSF